MKLIFLQAFKQMFLKERIYRTVIIILVKINHSGKAFSHLIWFSGWYWSYLKIRNMYKIILASEYSTLLSIPSFTPVIECFHSRGQHLCKFIGTKESVCIRKEFNSHRTGLGHQHGRRFIVLGHQYGRLDVMWKHSIELRSSTRSWLSDWKVCFRIYSLAL